MTATLERTTVTPRRVRLNGREFHSTGDRVIRFIEEHCVHTKGRWRGQPFRLLPWQQRLLYELFEVELGADGVWRRRYRWAYIEVPKKQGKTELIAALDVYLLCGDDEPSPEIACGANSDEQADLVFGAAKAMCQLSPTLSVLTACFQREISLRENPAAKILRVSAAVGTNDGKNLSAITLDELHEFAGLKGDGLFNVLTNATGAREQPLVLMITTAGYDLDTLCGRYHEHALKLLAGEIEDHTFYAKLYTTADLNLADDVAFEAALQQANPSFGHTVDLAFYRDQRKRKTPAVFKRYFLNIWTSAVEEWLPAGAWEACRVPAVTLTPDAPVYVGMDAATKYDSTAIVAVQWQGLTLATRAWVWERPLNPATGGPLDDWRLPMVEVEDVLRDLHRTYDVRAIAYDPAFITWLAQSLEADGLPMVEHPQTNARMVAPTQALYELIVDGRLAHNGDPALARHIRSAVAVQVPGGGQRLGKTRRRAPNDAAIALVMAVAAATRPEAAPAPEPRITLLAVEDA